MPTNKDLKRWYKHNKPNTAQDFARYTTNGRLETASAVEAQDAVTLAQLEEKTRAMLQLNGVENISSLPVPSEEDFGKIWNIANEFTTTADFVEGPGKTIPAHSNVAIIEIETDTGKAYKYDVVGSLFELDDYYTKTQTDAYLLDKQDKHNFKRVENETYMLLGTDGYTDVFVYNNATISFGDADALYNLKTLFIAAGCTVASSAAINTINVDFAQITLPYTASDNLHLVGYTADNLPLLTADLTVTQAPGQSTTNVMSEKAVTDTLNNAVSTINTALGEKVAKTGAESVSGVKTFADGIKTSNVISSVNNQPIKIAGPVVELETRAVNGTSVTAKLIIAGSENPSSVPHTIHSWEDSTMDLGSSAYKFRDGYFAGKLNGDIPFAEIQRYSKLLRIDNNNTPINIDSDEWTDVFAYQGKLVFKPGFSGKQIKSFYINKDFILENDGGIVSKINVDFTEKTLPYTAEKKMHLVGYTQSGDAVCPLFHSDTTITVTDNADNTVDIIIE